MKIAMIGFSAIIMVIIILMISGLGISTNTAIAGGETLQLIGTAVLSLLGLSILVMIANATIFNRGDFD